MKKYLRVLKNKKYLIIVGIIVVVGLFFLLSGRNNSSLETITIKHSDFTNEISASGRVISAESVDLGFYQGGRISSVRASIGEYVSNGTTIASIENGDLRAALEQRQASLLREQSKLKSLELGTRLEQLAVTESSVASAQIALDQARQSLINSISDSNTKADDAIRNKIDQFFQNPLTSSPNIVISTPDSSLIASVNFDRGQINKILDEWESSIASITSTSDLNNNILETQKNLNEVKLFLARVSLITNNTTSTYQGVAIPSTWKSDTSTARLNIDTAISSFTTVATAYKTAQATLDTARNTLKLQQAGATKEDIAAQEAQVKAAEADVISAQAMLEKTIISAPFSGQITKMDAKVGEIASPNIPLISMISSGVFQIESYIPEVNISKVKIGQSVKITLDAYGESVVFDAKVISIDPAETVKDGVSTYKTKFQFLNRDDRIKPGMTANASIVIFEKPNTIVIPEGTIYEKDGKKFVQVKKEDSSTEKEITTGEKSSLGQIEVLSGLFDGDSVILKPKIK